MILLFLLVLGVAIGYVNGANDVSKGIATLAGSGVTNARRAIAWGTLCTVLGGLAASLIAKAMVQAFGKGLFAPSVHPTIATALSVMCGAALWVGIATRKGLPVSTTHAIVGSIVGVAVCAFGLAGVNWSALTENVVLPLLLSPVAALILTWGAVRILRVFAPQTDCLCFEAMQPVLSATVPGVITTPIVQVSTCVATEHTGARGITFDHLHWLTSGATSFARGLNDTPKMVALVAGGLLVADTRRMPLFAVFSVITFGVLVGSWFAGGKVTDVLACKVIRIDHREGSLDNLVTAAMVGPGAMLGLPMSTTHVASGGILGLSSRERKPNLSLIRDLVLAWLVTLPGAALLAITSLLVFRAVGVK